MVCPYHDQTLPNAWELSKVHGLLVISRWTMPGHLSRSCCWPITGRIIRKTLPLRCRDMKWLLTIAALLHPFLEGIVTPWVCGKESRQHPVSLDTKPNKIKAAILNQFEILFNIESSKKFERRKKNFSYSFSSNFFGCSSCTVH